MSIEFDLQMVGTGSAFGKRYYNNSALLTFPDYRLLIDCGATTPLGLHEIGVAPDSINGIFITHLHGDHVNGLEELAFKYLYIHNKKPDLWIAADLVEPLWNECLKGGLQATTEGFRTLEDYFTVRPIPLETRPDDEDPTQIVQMNHSLPVKISESLTIEILRTPHIPQKRSYSLFINEEVFYSGDVRYDPQLLWYVVQERNVNVILHDCQLHNLSPVHAYLGDLMTLPEDAQEKIWLMHYNDNMVDFIGETGLMEFLEQHTRYRYQYSTLVQVGE